MISNPLEVALAKMTGAAVLAQEASWALQAVRAPEREALRRVHVTALELEACAQLCRDRIVALGGSLDDSLPNAKEVRQSIANGSHDSAAVRDRLDEATGQGRR